MLLLDTGGDKLRLDSGSPDGLIVCTGIDAGVHEFSATGLTVATTYYSYFYQEDGAVVSNVLESGAWSTLSSLAPAGRVNALQAIPSHRPRREFNIGGMPSNAQFGMIGFDLNSPSRAFMISGIASSNYAGNIRSTQTIGIVDAVLLMRLLDE